MAMSVLQVVGLQEPPRNTSHAAAAAILSEEKRKAKKDTNEQKSLSLHIWLKRPRRAAWRERERYVLEPALLTVVVVSFPSQFNEHEVLIGTDTLREK